MLSITLKRLQPLVIRRYSTVTNCNTANSTISTTNISNIDLKDSVNSINRTELVNYADLILTRERFINKRNSATAWQLASCPIFFAIGATGDRPLVCLTAGFASIGLLTLAKYECDKEIEKINNEINKLLKSS